MPRTALPLALLLALAAPARPADGNRLAYLDANDPYYVGRTFPKLVTPQWVSEDGVEAVVVLAIDDMRGPDKWEAYLRPILERLKRIDGRAPVSIMTCQIDPAHPHLQTWLKEGVSLETHTYDHPCPILQKGDLARAKATYDRAVDLLAAVPNSRPVAFRTPCCDSLNTVSPRLFTEIINRTTPAGRFITLDSSVFNLFTANDPALPRALVLDPDGRERFRKYHMADRTFVNFIEDYPYPYVVGRLCWEFPCVTPSDWQAQHRQKSNNPLTVRDWQAALDATVIKQGVYCLVFHPHGWIKNEQIIELIDYAVAKHGKKVKFLTFREAQERIDKHLLGGQPLRKADGGDNGVRLIDVDHDGYLDVVVGNEQVRSTRRWQPTTRTWTVGHFPAAIVAPGGGDAGVRFGVFRPDGRAGLLMGGEGPSVALNYDGEQWLPDSALGVSLSVNSERVALVRSGVDQGVRLRDVDGDGRCEIIAGGGVRRLLAWDPARRAWHPQARLPDGAAVVDAQGRDRGLRLVDLDGDGRLDVLWSNEDESGVYLFESLAKGWSQRVRGRQDGGALPLISRGGTDNGAWVRDRHLYVVNEHTQLVKDFVEQRSFNDLLAGMDVPAKSPEASLQALTPRPGFVAELVATEPLVRDPVAFAWGPDAKLYVVEMGSYPLGGDGKGKPDGRVKVLTDADGDGKYDRSTVFLDGLAYPTGVLPWRKGVLVTCAPDILYAEDTDGDGKADKRDVLFTGFREGNPQHLVNGLSYGLDGWVYGANGDSGGAVRRVKTLTPGPSPAKPGEGGGAVNLRGRDFRFNPDTGAFDLQTGQTQFGRCRDDWGHWFGGNNVNPAWHFALEDHYLRRNPHLLPPDPRARVPEGTDLPRVFPRSRTLPRFNDPHTADRFTSACGIAFYRDDLFGPAYAGNLFVCEPVHNLVSRLVVTPEGSTFRGRRAVDEGRSEFLASSDSWCRPVYAQTGPDGALWVADMYRLVIEHPEWIPQDWQRRLDLRAGADQGRIYRVSPVGTKPRAIPRLDRLDTAGLVAALGSPSGWQRDLAQQMLLWRGDRAAVPALEKLTTAERPLARLHALCTLDGLGALRPELLTTALADTHPGVRRHAVRMCEARLSARPALGEAVAKLAADPDVQVRMQAAYTLGAWNDARAGTALGTLAVGAGGDKYLTAAVLSSVRKENLDGVLRAVLGAGAPPIGLIEELLRLADAFDNRQATALLLEALAAPVQGRHPAWHFTTLAGLLDGLDRRRSSLRQLGERDPALQAVVARLAGLFAAARGTATDPNQPTAERTQAVRLLGRAPDGHADDLDRLTNLLTPQTPAEVQTAAVTALGRLRDSSVPERLLRNWAGHGPGLRAQVLEALGRRDDWLAALLAAAERGAPPAAEIDAARRQQLAGHRDAAVRARAEKLFGAAGADRQKVIDAHRDALTLAGDAARGKGLFEKHCATCHKLAGTGGEVGPDLAQFADRPADYLLAAILDPNRAVEPRYVTYVAQTAAGLTLTGVLAGESGNRLTLVGADGKSTAVLRTDLEGLNSTGRSLMPEGLEKDLKAQDFADLLAHVRSAVPGPPRREFAGNKPALVKPAADGSLTLTPATAAIYGPAIELEKQYGNLGHWGSPDDKAVWTVEARPGRYAVTVEWACEDSTAGNALLVLAGAGRMRWFVKGTGDWDTYRTTRIGELTLLAGPQRVEVRSDGPIAGWLIDLKSVRLVPVSER